MKKIAVMVVDDDIYVRQALETLIRRHPQTKPHSFVANPKKALQVLASGKSLPDVIVLDIHFQGSDINGIMAIKDIQKVSKGRPRILVCSMNKDQSSVLSAIKEGADGFIWKNESGEGIIAAVIKLAQGRFIVTKSIAERMLGQAVKLDKYVEILKERKQYKDLTESLRKTMYLYCLCGMSAKEIADELSLSIHTVISRIKLSYQLLNAGSRAEAFQKLIERES